MVVRSELEAVLERDPYDIAAHAVYADWLIEQGDPRGELAALTTASEWNRDALPKLLEFLEAHPELVPPSNARLTWCIQRAEGHHR